MSDKTTDQAAPTDDQIIAAIRTGCRTQTVADRLGMLVRRPYVLRRLKRLEKAGRVKSQSRYSFAWSLYWEVVSHAAE